MKWISIRDNLPQEDVRALVTDGIRITISEWSNSCAFWSGGFIFDYEITHWMPLPEPPQAL